MLTLTKAMGGALRRTTPLPCLTRCIVHYGSMHSATAGPVSSSERWHTIRAGLPAPFPIASCTSACYASRPYDQARRPLRHILHPHYPSPDTPPARPLPPPS